MSARPLLLLGANGQLGRELRRALPALGPVVAVGRAALDLRDGDAVREMVRAAAPGAIVNAAAYTAVDRAESERDAAWAVNATAPAVLAEEARRVDAALVHYSTDYVFDGTASRPYAEDAPTGPRNVYGASKLAGEEAVRGAWGRSLVLRTAWVYAAAGRSFVDTMVRLADEGREVVRVVDDQRGAPTPAGWLADATVTVLRAALAHEAGWGTYHLAAAGETTWHDVAAAIFADRARRGLPAPALERISTAEFGAPAARPAYSVLDTTRARGAFGVEPPHWADALAAVLDARPGPALRPALR
ncbi:dTDP-4-dehydrorhamnose reductase [Roseisolibacter sp. H3M3-2]|uniref:dTDP-4-dehydrorhamnose reductase n=1 Tax=Roseisolibacter sp. H3M3-2 TaxID=3031323 RepID=UPI0023DAF349|nr:dTDP-4-dehydrorhamnose reductase [Roseisolibacter sp. H3M3-2]MDF1503040.1 dTDP-4-dehydrorhamnose reductase [Roseisolibacter sp. H3M3-2]